MKTNNKLRQVRMGKGINQTQLAKSTGISRQTISGIEQGHIKRPSDETMIAIAEFLGCDVGDIFFTPLVNHVKQKADSKSA